MKKNKRRRNPTSLLTPESLQHIAGSAIDVLITQELRGMTLKQKTFLLAMLPQLKIIITHIPEEKLEAMTPETIITIH